MSARSSTSWTSSALLLLADDHVSVDHTGTGTPRSRFMSQPTIVSKMTPAAIAASCAGVVKKPRLTMGVVAPAGGCGEEKRMSRAIVIRIESAAAPIRGGVTPDARTLGAAR